MKVFARNFRGFKYVEMDTDKIIFLVGDNSSGKSSLLHLVDCIFRDDLASAPILDEELGADRYDYFSPYFNNAPVSFGFSKIVASGKCATKIITVKKSEEESIVLRCTYIHDGIAITVKKTNAGVQKRILKNRRNMRSLCLTLVERLSFGNL